MCIFQKKDYWWSIKSILACLNSTALPPFLRPLKIECALPIEFCCKPLKLDPCLKWPVGVLFSLLPPSSYRCWSIFPLVPLDLKRKKLAVSASTFQDWKSHGIMLPWPAIILPLNWPTLSMYFLEFKLYFQGLVNLILVNKSVKCNVGQKNVSELRIRMERHWIWKERYLEHIIAFKKSM